MENKIYSAIGAVMGEVSAISKDRRNAQQGFNFRGVDDVMNELHGLLAKHGVFIVPKVTHEERGSYQTKNGATWNTSRLTIDFTFYAGDGSSITATVIGEGCDSGDKASNKALSVGYKYACLQVFCIPTEEEKDPDASTPDPQPAQQQKPQPARQKAQQVSPEVEEMRRLLAETLPDGDEIFDDEAKNFYRGEVRKGAPLAQVLGDAKAYKAERVKAYEELQKSDPVF